MLSNCNWHQRPNEIIEISGDTARVDLLPLSHWTAAISLIIKVVYDLNRIERKLNRRSAHPHMVASIVKRLRHSRLWNSRGTLPVNNAGPSKSEIAGVGRKIPGNLKVNNATRAPKMIRQQSVRRGLRTKLTVVVQSIGPFASARYTSNSVCYLDPAVAAQGKTRNNAREAACLKVDFRYPDSLPGLTNPNRLCTTLRPGRVATRSRHDSRDDLLHSSRFDQISKSVQPP